MLNLMFYLTVNVFVLVPAVQDDQLPIPELTSGNCQVINEKEISPTKDIIMHRDASPFQPPQRNLTGQWQLQWNDVIDSPPADFPHSCVLRIKEIDNAITGKFVGPVAGTERDAIVTGNLEGTGITRLLTFQQRENGYVCSYQAIDNGGAITGIWHDTQNRSGTFKMLKYQ